MIVCYFKGFGDALRENYQGLKLLANVLKVKEKF